ncbi:DUF2634 domain-containing protein [Paenibacillus sp. BAC0078]
MIPVIGKAGPITSTLESETISESLEIPSLTYRMDWERKRILGTIDALEAVKQAAVKVLQTERYEHLIYSSDYGTEWNLVLGRDRLLARSELRRSISEALLEDERIRSLEDVEISFNGDTVILNCTVVTYYGNFEIRKEWNEGV